MISRWFGYRGLTQSFSKCADVQHIIWSVVWNMFFFHSVGNVIIPPDKLIFFGGVGQPPTSNIFSNQDFHILHIPSGYLTVCHGKSPFLSSANPGKPSISMGHLYHGCGYVSHNQRVCSNRPQGFNQPIVGKSDHGSYHDSSALMR